MKCFAVVAVLLLPACARADFVPSVLVSNGRLNEPTLKVFDISDSGQAVGSYASGYQTMEQWNPDGTTNHVTNANSFNKNSAFFASTIADAVAGISNDGNYALFKGVGTSLGTISRTQISSRSYGAPADITIQGFYQLTKGEMNNRRDILVNNIYGESYYIPSTALTATRLNTSMNALNNNGYFAGYDRIGHFENGVEVDEIIQSIFAVNANDINDANVVVGRATVANVSQPFMYKAGQLTLLDLPTGFTAGSALGINNAGDIVGYANNGGVNTAVLWKNGAPYVLNDFLTGFPFASFTLASTITDTGYVLADGKVSGVNVKFVANIAAVPEPAGLALLALTGAVALRRRRN